MVKIIVIHGIMGGGKSTITSELIKKLPDYVLVDKAYIKDTMLKKVKKDDADFARKLSRDATYMIAKELIAKGYNLILQETRAPSVKKYLGEDNEIKSFYLHCSLETAKKRDLERQNRHVRPEIVEEMYNKHGYADEEDISINTEQKSIYETVDFILEKI